MGSRAKAGGRVHRSALVAVLLASSLAIGAGCNSNGAAYQGGGVTPPHGGSGSGAACLRDEPGCACAHEGAIIQCGKATEADAGDHAVQCATGGEVCSHGTWSECLTNPNEPTLMSADPGTLKLIGTLKVKNLTNPGVACMNDPCDPYCIQFPDTATGIDAGDSGPSTLGCGEASVLSIVTNGSPDAGSAPSSVLADAALADGEGVIYIQLAPSQTATRTFTTPKAAVTKADIYFLIDDTSSMGAAAANLASALTNPSGIIQEIKALLPAGTTSFGVGRFEDFYSLPYAGPEPLQLPSANSPAAEQYAYNVPYENLLSVQTDQGVYNPVTMTYSSICGNTWPATCTAAAVSWLTVNAFNSLTPPQPYARSGGDIPEASVAALWATATGNGFYYNNIDMGGTLTGASGPLAVLPTGAPTMAGFNWYQVPRSEWLGSNMSPYGGSTYVPYPPDTPTGGFLPCGMGTVGSYPCFNQGAVPVIVMLTDAPAHEGPGGQYPHVNEVFATQSPHLTGATPWPIQPPAYAATTTRGAWTGGCPPGYDAAVATGGGTPVCSLTKFTSNPLSGLSFGGAIPLPTDSAGLPVSGVYYGYVPNSYRAPDTANTMASPANWFSASSVGGGVFTIPAIPAAGLQSPFVPGAHVRNSLRDCSSGDEGLDCTPGVNTPGGTPPICYDNTVTGHSLGVAEAAATITYQPMAGSVAATQNATQNHPTSTEPAIVGALTAGATEPGGTSAITVWGSNNNPTTTATVNPSNTTNATYTPGAVITETSFQIITAGTCTTALAPVVSIPAGEELTNLTVTVEGIGQGATAAISAYAVIGGSNYLTTGTVSSQGGSSSSAGGYYAGSSAVNATLTVAQSPAQCAAQSGSTIGITVTVTYQLATPNACPNVGAAYSLIQTAGAGSTSPTGTCVQCTDAGSTWNAGTSSCSKVCASGTQGNGNGGSSNTLCYSCPSGVLNTTTFTCSGYVCNGGAPAGTTLATNGNTAGGTATNATVNDCYYCSNGTVPSTGATWSCPYSACGANNTVSQTTHNNVVAGTCYTCAYNNGVSAPKDVVPNTSTVAAWTCPVNSADSCYYPLANFPGYVSANWTLGTGANGSSVNTCYNCTTLGAANTANTLETDTTPWQCSSCLTAPPAQTLDTGFAPYKCVSCVAPATLTNGGTNMPTCVTPAACQAGYASAPPNCTIDHACTGDVPVGYTQVGSLAALAAGKYYISNDSAGGVANSPATGWGVGCNGQNFTAGIPECAPDTVAGANAAGATCFITATSAASPGHDTCGCQLETVTPPIVYNAGNNPCPGPDSPTYSATGCSTAANGANCALAVTPATQCVGGGAGAGYASCQAPTTSPNATCTQSAPLDGGDGYYGNDIIYSFNVPGNGGFGSRYYYHFALLAQGPDPTSTWVTGGGGAGVPNSIAGSTPNAVQSFAAGPTCSSGGPTCAAGATNTPPSCSSGNPSCAQGLAMCEGGVAKCIAVQPFLYIKAAPGTTINGFSATQDPSYPFVIPSTAAASDDVAGAGGAPAYGGTVGSANGPVLDCNKNAHSQLLGPSPNNDSYVLSEIDGYLPPGNYYLVIDNAQPLTWSTTGSQTMSSPPPAYQYFLQVGGFDDVPANATTPPSITQPSYDQMISSLVALQAKFVGVDNSGISCLRPGETTFWQATSTAQMETRDFMEKVAFDLGSYDSTTNPVRPYVVPVSKDGTSCNPAPPAIDIPGMPGAPSALAEAYCANPVNFATPLAYDQNAQVCTPTCGTNSDCPMDAPTCSNTACGGVPCCTSGCAGGVAGLSCAVAAAVSSLTSNLKQNVYLRPISTTSGSSYVAPGATCTPNNAMTSMSPQCTGMMTGGTACYGGSCTIPCTNGGGQCGTSFVCVASTIPGDPNYGYCISPAVFIQSVQAVSTDTPMANPMTGSDAVCGLHPAIQGCVPGTAYPGNGCPSGLPSCLTMGPGAGTCGISDTGPDTVAPQPPYYNAAVGGQDNDGMFNLCLPGAQVNFNVTFVMPFQRSAGAQQYEFDLGIYAGPNLVGRTRVILENPALSTTNFYRYYNGSNLVDGGGGICAQGSHVVWGDFTYKAICPSDGAGDYSQIKFCGKTATSMAGLAPSAPPVDISPDQCAPGEVLLWIATNDHSNGAANGNFVNTCPANGAPGMQSNCAPLAPTPSTPLATWAGCEAIGTQTACNTSGLGCQWLPPAGGVNVGDVLAAYAKMADAGAASNDFLRIRMEFDPSSPGDAVAPFLYSWDLDVDCIPSE